MTIGRFLATILSDLYKWYQNEDLYLQENRTKVGGKAVWLPGFQRSYAEKGPVEPSSVLAWAQFQQVLRKWHRRVSKVGGLLPTDHIQYLNGGTSLSPIAS